MVLPKRSKLKKIRKISNIDSSSSQSSRNLYSKIPSTSSSQETNLKINPTGDMKLIESQQQMQKATSSSNESTNVKDVNRSFDMMKLPYAPIQPTFDFHLANDHFPIVNTSNDLDDSIRQAIDERLPKILPNSEDVSNLSQTVSKLMLILERLKQSPEQIDACKVDCFHLVGSLRMGTILYDHRVADLVVVLQTLPVKAALSALGNKLLEELQRMEPTNSYQINLFDDHFEIINLFNKETVRILIATTTNNLNKLDRDIHVRKSAIQRHLRAVMQVRWFEENIVTNDVHDFILIVKDVCSRFNDFVHFYPWMIIIVCHYSMTRINKNANNMANESTSSIDTTDNDNIHNKDNQIIDTTNHLPIQLAFKRLLQLLSSGLFLPYSLGIPDPCEPKMPIHGKLSVYDQEKITKQAQILLRLLYYKNGCRFIFGLDNYLNINIIEHHHYINDETSSSVQHSQDFEIEDDEADDNNPNNSNSSDSSLSMMKHLHLNDRNIIDNIRLNDNVYFRESISVFDNVDATSTIASTTMNKSTADTSSSSM